MTIGRRVGDRVRMSLKRMRINAAGGTAAAIEASMSSIGGGGAGSVAAPSLEVNCQRDSAACESIGPVDVDGTLSQSSPSSHGHLQKESFEVKKCSRVKFVLFKQSE